MKFLLIIMLTLLTFSCGSTDSIPKPVIAKELSIQELNRRNLIPVNYPYKKNYTRIMSYLYKNDRQDFLEIKGDFRNIKFGNDSAYNMMVGYWEEYGQYSTSLVVMVRTSDNSKVSIKRKEVTVSSSKFGDLMEVQTKNLKTYQDFPPLLFIRKIDIKSKYDIIELIKGDEIVVTIDGVKYEFVNPEIE